MISYTNIAYNWETSCSYIKGFIVVLYSISAYFEQVAQKREKHKKPTVSPLNFQKDRHIIKPFKESWFAFMSRVNLFATYFCYYFFRQ